jgi:alcohol dehydrogenase
MMETGTQFQYFVPTKIIFGRGQVKKLHTCKLPGKKALIVITSGKSTREHGYLDTVEQELKLAQVDYAIFDKVDSNPVVQNIVDGSAMAREQHCDFIIGLGGGSPIDASKAIALMATNEGELWDYIAAGSGKGLPVQVKPLPVVAIVTTAGTGSEADPAFVVSKEDTKEKIGLYLPDLYPTIAIVDPELMTTVPPKFTAFQGFDALFHSTEGYISNKANWMSDMVALTAIEAIGQNLVVAVQDGSNLFAREKVALGSTLSGIQMAVGSLTSEHSLEHAMSAYHQNLPHGAGLVLISVAYYKRFIDTPELRERFIRMAKAMGIVDANKPMDFIHALEQLIKDCGLTGLTMSDYGITKEELVTFAKNAKFTMGSKFFNDYVTLSEEDCVNIYEESFK